MSHDFGFVREYSLLKRNYAILDVIVVNEQTHFSCHRIFNSKKVKVHTGLTNLLVMQLSTCHEQVLMFLTSALFVIFYGLKLKYSKIEKLWVIDVQTSNGKTSLFIPT